MRRTGRAPRPVPGSRPPGRAALIVTAAGVGRRFGGRRRKAFVPLAGRPLLLWSLRAAERTAGVADVILVVHRGDVARARALVARARCRKVRAVVPGGATRAESVYAGWRAVPTGVGLVAVHDAARPLVTPALITRVLAAAARWGAAVAAAPVIPTIKQVDRAGRVTATLDRRRLRAAQTPQAFRRPLLAAAYRRVRGGARAAATDEAMLVARCGVRSVIVDDSPRNLKITTPEDLRVAEALARR